MDQLAATGQFLTQTALPTATNVLGRGVDVVETLNALAGHADALARYEQGKTQALQDPTLRAIVGQSPFLAGAFGQGLGAPSAAQVNRLSAQIPPGESQLLPTRVPQLPPMTETGEANQALAHATASLIRQNPELAARAALNIGMDPAQLQQWATSLQGVLGPGVRASLPIPGVPGGRFTTGAAAAPHGDVFPLTPEGEATAMGVAQTYTRLGTPSDVVADQSAGVVRVIKGRASPAQREVPSQIGKPSFRDALTIRARGLDPVTGKKISPEEKLIAKRETRGLERAAVGQVEAKGRAREQVKNEAISQASRPMYEAAPAVLQAINRVEQAMQGVALGPGVGRWQDFWAGKIGAPDPAFIRLRQTTRILGRIFVRMHVGARAAGQTIAEDLLHQLDEGKQSPDNMQAALDAVRDYASDLVAAARARGMNLPELAAPASGSGAGPGTGGDVDAILRKHGY